MKMLVFWAFFAACLGVLGCGGKAGIKKSGASTFVEREFSKVADRHNIPKRMLFAAGWLESKLNPQAASSFYLNRATEIFEKKEGTDVAQTAFGISRAELQLDDSEEADLIEVQAEAYAAWLESKVSDQASLNSRPKTTEEKFNWIWEITRAHIGEGPYSRNIRVVFAKEMIRILNEGFTWQDRENLETFTLGQEKPRLELEKFSPDIQNQLNLTSRRPEIDSAMFLPLGKVNSTQENKPTHIKVVHCPLSLSACLRMQDQNVKGIRMEAHYIIPRNSEEVEEPVQITKHRNTILLTDKNGAIKEVSDAIVIMLVGNSGRIVEGHRNPANPRWLTKWQIQRMGEVINDVCRNLEENYNVKIEKCLKLNQGVTFQQQESDEPFLWGDVADFDSLIFESYVNNPGGLLGETVFDLPKEKLVYSAGDTIPLRILFRPSVNHIEIEKLVRCPDQKVVWASVISADVRSQTSFKTEKKLYDAGPNKNGNQFFRAKVYDGDGSLVGWDTAEIYLKNFEENDTSLTPKTCLLHGS